jgi:Protein of unknown function (DUF1810)
VVPTLAPSKSCSGGQRPATGCGSSSRRSPGSDIALPHGSSRSTRWLKPGPTWSTPSLAPRLVECARIVAETEGRTARQIFGEIDAQKLHSSMTLFLRAAPDELAFQQVLDRYFDSVPDVATETSLRRTVGP